MVETFQAMDTPWTYYMVIFGYLVLTLANIFILLGWTPVARLIWSKHKLWFRGVDAREIAAGTSWRYTALIHDIPFMGTCWALRWSRSFQVCVSILQLASFMLVASSFRIWQLIMDGNSIIGRGDIVFTILLLGLADAMRRMNRAGAIRKSRTMRWQWYALNGAMTGAGFAVLLLAVLVEMGYVAPLN